jgi:uncharacterized protein
MDNMQEPVSSLDVGLSNSDNSSSETTHHMPIQSLQAVPVHERIGALDVVRGFALIGIFLMNIEFFNRSIHELGNGMPQGLKGLDWTASFFVQYFVAGKFWTLFSLLFGMGFALMLTRAEEKGQAFLKPYMRRVAALAVFGILHYILLWPGDILLSYAATAVMLLVILFGKTKWIILSIILCVAIGFIPHLSWVGAFAAILGTSGFIILFVRVEKIVDLKIVKLPLLSMIYFTMGIVILIVATVMFFIPSAKENSLPLMINSIVILTLAYLMARYHQPKEHRTLRAGIGFYTSIFVMMTAFGAYDYYSPKKDEATDKKTVVIASKEESKTTELVAKSIEKPAEKQTDEVKQVDEKVKKSEKKKLEVEKAKAKKIDDKKVDIETLTKGSYVDAVKMRVKDFKGDISEKIMVGLTAIPLFLIGFWFVYIGIMKDTKKHLPLFKKLTLWCLPIGVGMGLLSAFITTGHIPGQEKDGFVFAMGLQMLGNLPACIGYMSALVWLLHSRFDYLVKFLAPYGRMALTNYLMQSLIASYFFYGYGWGLWGMGRAEQVGFVFVIVVIQILFSHWWLARYKFGPLEAIWRAITYWKLPAMRH